MSIEAAVWIDLLVLLSCVLLLLRFARLTHSHPATTYLLFHLLVVSFRSMAIAFLNAPTLFSDFIGYRAVQDYEIVRAVLLADLCLACLTAGWIYAARRYQESSLVLPKQPPILLRRRILFWVAAFCIPVGLVSIFLFARLPGVEQNNLQLGSWSESSWILVVQSWAALALLALIYVYGARLWLMLPLGLYLGVMMYQGYHRFRVVIPIILVAQVMLDRRGKRWPAAYQMMLGVILLLAFFPMKQIGTMLQHREPIQDISEVIRGSARDALAGRADDQKFLDEFACAITASDELGRRFYGRGYLTLLTLPIPRQLWPQKPGLADHLRALSTNSRPIDQLGMITTMPGEFYLNFGVAGVVLMSFFYAVYSGKMFYFAYARPYYSVARFAYLLVACNLVQVYRDGLVSIIVFTVVNMMPLAAIVGLHLILRQNQPGMAPMPAPAGMRLRANRTAGNYKPTGAP